MFDSPGTVFWSAADSTNHCFRQLKREISRVDGLTRKTVRWQSHLHWPTGILIVWAFSLRVCNKPYIIKVWLHLVWQTARRWIANPSIAWMLWDWVSPRKTESFVVWRLVACQRTKQVFCIWVEIRDLLETLNTLFFAVEQLARTLKEVGLVKLVIFDALLGLTRR